MSLTSAAEKITEELEKLPAHQCHPTVMWCLNHLATAAKAEILALRTHVEALEKKR